MARLKIWDAQSNQWKYVDSSDTASYSLTSNFSINSIYSLTSSYFNQLWLQTGSIYPITSSWSNNSLISNTGLYSSQSQWSISSSFASSSISASYSATSSWALNVVGGSGTSIFATQSVYATQSVFATQSVYSVSASWASSSVSSSYLIYTGIPNGTASHALDALTASYAATASVYSYYFSYVNVNIVSASFASSSFSSSWASSSNESISASYAKTASYLNQGAQIFLSQSYIHSVTGSSQPAYEPAMLWWDDNAKTYAMYSDHSGVALQIGQEEWIRAYAGEHIPNGSPVYVSSSLNSLPIVKLALAVSIDDTAMTNVIGLATENISSGSIGIITSNGQVHDLNTLGYNAGQLVYLSPYNSGSLIPTMPVDPYPKVSVGYVLNVDATNGIIQVDIQNNGEENYPFVGVTSVPIITSLGGNSFSVSTCSANFCETSDGTGHVHNFTVPSSSFTITSSFLDVQFLTAVYNNGNPTYAIHTDLSSVDEIQTVPVATFTMGTSGAISYVVWDSPGILLANKLNKRITDIYGAQKSNGLLLTTSASHIQIGTGNGYIGVKQLTFTTASTTNQNQFVLLSHSASAWSGSFISGFINNLVDNGVNTVPIQTNKYVVNYVYRGIGSQNRAQVIISPEYVNYADAVNSTIPTPPPELKDIAILVGRIVAQQGVNSALLVENVVNADTFISTITSHNNLLNIQGGATNEYYHLDSASYAYVMSRTSSWANDSVYSIQSGYSTSSLSSSWASSSLSSSYTLTASYVGTGINNYFPKWSNNTLTSASLLYDNGTIVGVGVTSSAYNFDVTGSIHVSDLLCIGTPTSAVSRSMISGIKILGNGSNSNFYGISIEPNLAYGGISASINAVNPIAIISQSTAGNFRSILAQTHISGPFSASKMVGITIQPIISVAGASVIDVTGVELRPALNVVGSTMANYRGLWHNQVAVTAGAITNSYAIYVDDAAAAGVITNNYGLYIVSQSKGSSVNYPIYSQAGIHILGGTLAVGTTGSFVNTLHVQGNVSASSYTGSLLGTASFSNNSTFANQSVYSTQSVYTTQSIYSISASWASSSVYSTTASYVDLQANQVRMLRYSGSTYSTVQHLQDIFHSAGWIRGGEFATGSISGSFTVNSGSGLIRQVNSTTQPIYWCDWSASAFTCSTGLENTDLFVYVTTVGANAVVVTSSVSPSSDYQRNILLGNVYYSSQSIHNHFEVHTNTVVKETVADHAKQMILFNKAIMPYAHEAGAIIGDGGNRTLTVTAGAFWEGLNRFTTDVLNTSGSDSFSYYYQSGSGLTWIEFSASATRINNAVYNNTANGTFTPLNNNRYRTDWVYLGVDSDLYVVLGTNNDIALATAEAASQPATVPAEIQNDSFIIAQVIVGQGQVQLTEVRSVFVNQFTSTPITNHNSLSGLQGGAGNEYYHLTSAEYTGIGTGNFVRQNNPTINGLIATGSLFGTSTSANSASWASSSISSSYAGTASYIGTGTDGYFPTWTTNTLSSTSKLYSDGTSVGIGTNTFAVNPIGALVINETANRHLVLKNTNTGGIPWSLVSTDDSNFSSGSKLVFLANNEQTNTPFLTLWSGSVGGRKVGINKAFPASSLDVSGSVSSSYYLSNTSILGFIGTASFAGTSSYALTASYIRTPTNAFIQSGNSFGTTAVLGAIDKNRLDFISWNTVVMSVSRSVSGNLVGIGTTTPSAVLTVDGPSTYPTTAAGGVGLFQLKDASNNFCLLDAGVSATGTGYAWIQALDSRGGAINLNLQGAGGSVGIGTTGNPLYPLHVYGNSETVRIHRAADANQYIRIFLADTATYILSDSPKTAKRDFVIGTEISDATGVSSGTQNLVFQTNGSNKSYISEDGHFIPTSDNTYDIGAPTFRWRNIYVANGITASVISGSITNATSASYALSASWASSASYALSASWALSASHALTSSYAFTSSYSLTASYVSGAFLNAWLQGGNTWNALGVIGTLDKNDISVIANNTEIIRISGSGRVGINTSDPQTALHVFGAISASSFGSGSFAGTSSYAINSSTASRYENGPSVIYSNNTGNPLTSSLNITAAIININNTSSGVRGFSSGGSFSLVQDSSTTSSIISFTNNGKSGQFNVNEDGKNGSINLSAGGDNGAINITTLGSTGSITISANGAGNVGGVAIYADTQYGSVVQQAGDIYLYGSTGVHFDTINGNLTSRSPHAVFSAPDTTNILDIDGTNKSVGIGVTTASVFKLQVAGNVGPNADNTYDLGSAAYRWRNIYVANGITASVISGSISNAISASYALTASYALNGGSGGTSLSTGSTYPITSSWSVNAKTASYIGSGTDNYVPKWSSNTLTSTSLIYDNGTNVGIGIVSPTTTLHVSGTISASLYNGWNIRATSSLNNTSTNYIVVQSSTGSYIAAYFDYAIISASNSRAGTIFGTWNGASIVYTEYSTIDIGDTSQVTMSVVLNGGVVQLLSNTNTTNWNIRALSRYL